MLRRLGRSQLELIAVMIGGGLMALAVAVLGVVAPLAVPALIGLALALAVAWFFVRRPWAAFGAFVIILPAHVLLMAILLSVVGLPAGVVKVLSAWKEGLLLLMVLAVALRLPSAKRVHFALPDLFIALYGLYVVIIALASLFTTAAISAWAYGVRDVMLPLVLYLIGRSLPLNEQIARYVIYLMLFASLAFAAIGIFERLFIPTTFFVTIGLPRYFRELLGVYYPDYLMGLPENFWTSANSGLLRRAVSVYGSSQPFALSFLMFVPFAIYALIERRVPNRLLVWATLLLSLAGLLLTITRFTIILCVGLMALAAALSSARARRLLMIGLVALAISGVVVLIAVPSVRLLVVNTITFQDHSSSSRLQVWAGAIQYIVDNPIGSGLSSAGQTGARFGVVAVRIEGQYSKVGVEQGLIGLLLYITTLAVLSMYLLRAAFRSRELFARGVCFALALAFIGLSLNSMTTEWQNSPALLYPIYWLAGSGVAYAARVSLSMREAQALDAARATS